MTNKKQISIKYQGIRIYHAKCPKCGSETSWLDNKSIDVNCYSRRNVEIPKMIAPYRSVCTNPLCEWSKVKFDERED